MLFKMPAITRGINKTRLLIGLPFATMSMIFAPFLSSTASASPCIISGALQHTIGGQSGCEKITYRDNGNGYWKITGYTQDLIETGGDGACVYFQFKDPRTSAAAWSNAVFTDCNSSAWDYNDQGMLTMYIPKTMFNGLDPRSWKWRFVIHDTYTTGVTWF